MSGLQYISGSKHYEQRLVPVSKLPDEPAIAVEIGDSKQLDTFYPQVKLQRFDNTANVSFRYIGGVNGKVTKRLGKVTQEFSGGKVEIYDKTDEQAYELELVLDQLPAFNSFPFSYRTKGVTAWDYQAALTDEDIKEGCERPENVVGSYALSGPHGKLFHLYRPHVVDANGNETWGELRLDEDNQEIDVVVDRQWLSNAAYPVRIDPTIGYTSVGASSATFSADQPFASKMAGVSGTFSLTELYGYRQANTGTANFKIALYDSDGTSGGPGTLLHTTAGQSCDTTAQWQSYSLTLDVTSDFWIMQVSDSTCKYYFDTSASEGTRLSGVTAIPGFFVSPDNPWSASYTIKTNLYSQYAVYSSGTPMTGVVDVELSVAGDMLVSEPMTGQVELGIDVSGAMLVPEAMFGSVEIEVDVAGAMVIAPVMEGSIEIELSTEGNLLVPEPMTGDAAMQLDVSGEMLVPVPMSGDIEVKLDVDGSMEVFMSGGVGIEVGVSGAMVVPPEIPIPDTVISQYANSPRLVRLIKNVAEYIDPATNFNDFYDYVWNVDTAQGFGLDIWGKIVGVSREIEIDIEDDPFGFETGLSDYQPFNQGTFYTGETFTATYKLDDDAFRLLILTKALANITDCSVPSINRLLQNLFADRGRCYVNDLGNMLIRYTFEFVPEPHELSIITKSGVFPHPSGVHVFMIIAPEAFGFQEAGDHDVFNAGVDPQTGEYSGSPFFNQENLYAI